MSRQRQVAFAVPGGWVRVERNKNTLRVAFRQNSESEFTYLTKASPEEKARLDQFINRALDKLST